MRIGISCGSAASFERFFNQFFDNPELESYNYLEQDKYDLVLFTGGADISPEIYGEKNTASYTNPERDRWEIFSYEMLKQIDTPMMGICRGHQFLNAMEGGKLIQDINPRHPYKHYINIEASDDLLLVNSTHHQAVRETPLEIIATAPKNDLSGFPVVEMSARPSMLTMQFHPESFMPEELREFIAMKMREFLPEELWM
jgi:putative glutamine amidotransferase